MRVTIALAGLVLLAAAAPAARAYDSRAIPKDLSAYGATSGVSVVAQGAQRFMVFGPRAAKRYRRIAGRNYAVECHVTPRSSRTPLNVSAGFRSTTDPLPRRRTAFRENLDPGADFCELKIAPRKGAFTVSGTPPVASVAISEWGAAILARRPTAYLVSELHEAALTFETRLATAAELLQGAPPRLVVLPDPDAEPPAYPRIGVFADGQGRAVVRARAADGYVLSEETNGDQESGNTRIYLEATDYGEPPDG